MAKSKERDLTSIRRSTMFGMIANRAVQSRASDDPWTNAASCRCHGCASPVTNRKPMTANVVAVIVEPNMSRDLRLNRSASVPPISAVPTVPIDAAPPRIASWNWESVICSSAYIWATVAIWYPLPHRVVCSNSVRKPVLRNVCATRPRPERVRRTRRVGFIGIRL